ncbi:MAG: hypothetical protein ACOYIR_02310 [Christensenellales bacterium]|jgi:hypothetical protein
MNSNEGELMLLRRELALRRAGREDPAFFIETFCRIEDRDAPGVIVPFSLWPAQKKALSVFCENRLTVVLKARQLGLTWLALCYAAMRMYYTDGYSVIALSRTEGEAKELVRRMSVIFANMGDLVGKAPQRKATQRGRRKKQLKTTALEVTLSGSPSSTFKAMASGPSAGRSFTANLIILDEWAFQQYAREIWTAAFPVVNRPTGGQVIGLSTIARGTLFEEIYTGDIGFKKLFLPWNADPRRDWAWYQDTKKALGEAVRQEYPATEEEAFCATGGAFFPELDASVHLTGSPDLSCCRIYISIDYGLDALAALWYAVDAEGNAVVYRELYKSGLIVSEAAEEILRACGEEKVFAVFAPPDLFSRNRDTGRSTADIFAEKGLPLTRTSNARVSGWLDVKEWLKVQRRRDPHTGEIKPFARLRFVAGATRELWRTMTAIRCSTRTPTTRQTPPTS